MHGSIESHLIDLQQTADVQRIKMNRLEEDKKLNPVIIIPSYYIYKFTISYFNKNVYCLTKH